MTRMPALALYCSTVVDCLCTTAISILVKRFTTSTAKFNRNFFKIVRSRYSNSHARKKAFLILTKF